MSETSVCRGVEGAAARADRAGHEVCHVPYSCFGIGNFPPPSINFFLFLLHQQYPQIPKMTPPTTYNYLVVRRNFADLADFGRDQVLACYTKVSDANRHAKAEIQKIYEQALADNPDDPISPPKELKSSLYRGRLIVDDEWISLHSVEMFVDGILVRENYVEEPVPEVEVLVEDGEDEMEEDLMDTDNDAESDSEESDYQIELDPAVQYPFGLPKGRAGCLSGMRFCMLGEQEPYNESTIKALIKLYEGTLLDFKRARGDWPTPELMVFTILGKLEEGDPKLLQIQGKNWIDPVLDQKKLFVMIENLGGTEDRERLASFRDEERLGG